MNSLTQNFQLISGDMTITAAIEKLRLGEISSVQLVNACLERAEQGKELNIFVTIDQENALKAAQEVDDLIARGEPLKPLSGIPIVVKDNIHTAGLRTTAGSPAFAHFYPENDAPTVAKLREAGAIIIGKTNMHELAFGATGYNKAFNTGELTGVRNPYDSNRIAGGSSSGSAAALGARMAFAALGTDTGGSMRIPPALNGCASLRPSAGRYSLKGLIPIAESRDTVGPMALSMEDLKLIDSLITDDFENPEIQISELRLGLPEEFWCNLDEDTAELTKNAIEQLKAQGITFVEIKNSQLLELNQPVGFSVVIYEAYDCMVNYLKEYDHQMTIEELSEKISSPDVKTIYEEWILPRKIPTADGLVDVEPLYHAAQNGGRDLLRQQYEQIFNEYQIDALIFPTTAIVAPLANDEIYKPENFDKLIQNTEASASVGLPSIQLPVGLGTTTGLPVGIELDAPKDTDRRLLAIGQLIESILGRLPSPQ